MKAQGRFSKPGNLGRLFHRSFSWIWLVGILAVTLSTILAHAQNSVVLVGSGSSVPAPLYNRLAQEYGKRGPNSQMRYLPIGTSEGIKQISHGSGDFGAGEVRLTADQRAEASLIELPAVLIAIVPIYSLPDVWWRSRLTSPP